jgi:Ran GTPase-activating protein (RanGAP) involved in mRNA processing and transport
MRLLYKAKCRDIVRAQDQNQYDNFKNYIFSKTKNRTFDMVDNNLGIASANVIANRLMRHNENFAHYKLGSNNLGDVGAELIADVLCNSLNIVSLDLSMNRITSIGINHIANALSRN